MKGTRRVRERVELPFPVASNVDELGFAQNGQVARNLRLEFPKDLAQVTNADFLLRLQEIQNPQTRRIGEGAKEVGGIHIHKIEYDRSGRTCQG
jgi:hypothetical protein